MLRKGVTAASRGLPGGQHLVDERTAVTGEVRADAAPSTLVTHTGVLSSCRLSPQAGVSSCWPPGVCFVETVYRLKFSLN